MGARILLLSSVFVLVQSFALLKATDSNYSDSQGTDNSYASKNNESAGLPEGRKRSGIPLDRNRVEKSFEQTRRTEEPSSLPPSYSPPPLPASPALMPSASPTRPAPANTWIPAKRNQDVASPSSNLTPPARPTNPAPDGKPDISVKAGQAVSTSSSSLRGDKMPTIEELKDPKKPWGLNLANVYERGLFMRTHNQGKGGNDISNFPGLVANARDKLNQTIQEIVKLTSQITPSQFESLSKENGPFLKYKDYTVLLDTLNQLKTKIERYNNISTMQTINRNKLKAELNLTDDQVDAIPPLRLWDTLK